MSADPKLRAVPETPEERLVFEPDEPGNTETPSRIPVLLGLLLAVCIALLIWSRMELADGAAQISSLENRVGVLENTVSERDAEIAAQKDRLSDVRTRVQGLLSLLDAPVGSRPSKP
ncbi:MAG: hypothetical protein GY725_07510 [bacterium]|nr:hypothetical protein [bacterium]